MGSNFVNIITELDQYIASAKTRLQTILTTLDWTVEDSLKESTCLNSKAEKEKEECFHRNDPPLPESFGCSNSVVIDETQLQTILQNENIAIPTKFSDVQLNFTRNQKCELYDYVIANTTKTSEPELKVSFPNDQTDYAMTFAEIVARARKKDKKLQRKYRTSKPTHIEEVRNLVSLQMQALDKYFNPDTTSTEPSSSSYKKQSVTKEEILHDSVGRSRFRDNLMNGRKKSKSRSTDRKRASNHNFKRKSDKKEESLRRKSRSTDRRDRLLKRRSPNVEKRKHSYERRSRSLDEPHSRDKIKKKKTRSKTPKSKKKKHKHHRKHSITK